MNTQLAHCNINTLPSTFAGMASVANSIPMLGAEHEARLVHAWSTKRDVDAARELVLAHLRLVIRCVRDHEGYGLGREDMVQEGLVGLMKAVHRFRSSMGVRLGVFARHWIVAQIREYIFHNWRIVRLGTGKAMKKLFFGYRSTIERLARMDPGARPSLLDEHTAHELGVDLHQVRIASGFLLGEDAPADAPSTSREMVAWQDPLHAIIQAEQASSHDQVQQALRALPPRERDIVRSRFLLEKPQPLRVLADRHGVSIERVRQIEKKALQTMAGALHPDS